MSDKDLNDMIEVAELMELTYPERTGGLSAAVSIARISLESTMEVYGNQMSDDVKERLTDIINKLNEANSTYAGNIIRKV